MTGQPETPATGEQVRLWFGEHYHEVRDAFTDALTGMSTQSATVPPDRARAGAVLCLNMLAHLLPDPPWQADIDDALHEFSTGIGTGMERCEPQEFDPETAADLHRKLDAFDAVRARGEVEGRNFTIGGAR